MTKQQMNENIKAWNIDQGKIYDSMQAEYKAIHDKYFALLGSVSCSYVGFVAQVAACDKVSDAERESDLAVIIRYFEACGRWAALLGLIDVIA